MATRVESLKVYLKPNFDFYNILTKTRICFPLFCREHEIGRFWYQFSLSLSPSQGLPINHSIAIDTGPNPWIPAQSPYQNYNWRCGLWKSFRGRSKYSLHLCMGWSQRIQTGKIILEKKSGFFWLLSFSFLGPYYFFYFCSQNKNRKWP